MSYRKLLFFIILLKSFTVETFGQAIEVTYFGFSNFQKGNDSPPFFYGFGYEQNLGSRIAVSLNWHNGFTFDDQGGGSSDFESLLPGVNFSYYSRFSWKEFSYTSKFFFSDNESQSWYVSSGIAYRMTSATITTYSIFATPGNESIANQLSAGGKKDNILIPISISFGGRGSLDDWFGDYFIGFSYIPGADKKSSGNPTLDTAIGKGYYRNFCINFGLRVGFGWAD